MEMSSASAMFGQSSAQLVKPNLGFMRLLPPRTTIVSSSSIPRFLRMESQSQPRQSISCSSSPKENVSHSNSSSSYSIESGRFLELDTAEMEAHFFFD